MDLSRLLIGSRIEEQSLISRIPMISALLSACKGLYTMIRRIGIITRKLIQRK
jgi:hypothetical protein